MPSLRQTSRSAYAGLNQLLRTLRTTPKGGPRPRSLNEALRGKRVVVTGASSGIGKALALQVAAHGGFALLVARKLDKLREVKAQIEASGGAAQVYVADLSLPADCDRVVAELLSDGPVDVLINNAGRSIRRSVRHSYQRAHDYERTMAINYFGSLRLILGLLPHMRERKSGHVINISSAGVLFKTPRFSAYIASKAALDAFSAVAAAESYHDRVYFSTIYMPLVRTPMIAPTDVYRGAPALSPERAARLTLSALYTRKTRVMPVFAGLMALSHALSPVGTLRALSAMYRVSPGQTKPRAAVVESPRMAASKAS